MSIMVAFTNHVNDRIRATAAYGWQMVRVYMNEEGVGVLVAAAMRQPCEALDLAPETRIHGVPVAQHERIPQGHVWFVFKGGKK